MKNAGKKPLFHPRNRHCGRYDFALLQQAHPPLAAFVRPNGYGDESIDFANPAAVKALNQALLIHFWQIKHWSVPEGFLCPPIPGRADYLHYLADLLAEDNHHVIPSHATILDIGCGANCIYPLIGYREYGWRFTGSDVNEAAISAANAIIVANPGLAKGIRVRRQKNKQAIFHGIIHKNECFYATLCNPPFHASLAEASQASQRKQHNLGIKRGSPLNFGGRYHELWCEGGESAFIQQMIKESADFSRQCGWFTSLVSRKEHLPDLLAALKLVAAQDVRVIDMVQGHKQSRFLAWSFFDNLRRARFLTQIR